MNRHLISFFRHLAVFCLLGIVVAGCNRQEQSPPEPQPQKTRPSKTSYPIIRIGLIPEQDIFTQKKRYEPLLAELSKALGVSIEIHMLPRYGNIIDSFNQLGLDGAFFGSFTGALAINKIGVEPLARPLYNDGTSSYYGMVFVRKNSGIKNAEDMRNKRMVFVDKATTAGYLLPLAYFKTLGIDDYRSWFREYYFSGNHEDAIREVLNGYADVGAAKNTVFYRVAKKDNRVLEHLEILATSPHVPANSLAVRKDLPANIRQDLKQQLLTMHERPEGRDILQGMNIEKFIETTAEDYRPVFEYAKTIGLDLKTYNYRNN